MRRPFCRWRAWIIHLPSIFEYVRRSIASKERAGRKFEPWKNDVERRDQGLIDTLEDLYCSEGARVGWILLADSMEGSLVLLSLTGVVLWTELNRRRTIGATIFLAALAAAIVLALQSL